MNETESLFAWLHTLRDNCFFTSPAEVTPFGLITINYPSTYLTAAITIRGFDEVTNPKNCLCEQEGEEIKSKIP